MTSVEEDGDFLIVGKNEIQNFTEKEDDGAKLSDPEMYEMNIESNVRHRYARTVVTSKVVNLNSIAREATFSVIIPDKAFISEFVMVIGGKEYKAYVKEKEEAENVYKEAVASGVAAAHVAVTARESNRFTVSVNVEPLSKATFILIYEELLRRKENMYELIINIHPKQPIKDLFVRVVIDESRPLKFVKTPSVRTGNEITAGNGDLNPRTEIHQLNPKAAVIKFKPTLERQKELAINLGTEANEGLSGQFVVQYDVERDPTGGEVLVQGGYFVHFFAPSDLKPMNKFIIFVLDTSTSMESGHKISQLKQAMNAILDQLDTEDYFHLVGFDSNITVWNIDQPKRSVKTSKSSAEVQFADLRFASAFLGSPENIKKAKLVLTELNAGGYTNIYEALKVALILIERKKFNVSHKTLPQPIVMFLTDGEPTIGVTDKDIITSDITKLNSEKAPIFSLSFGEDADKNFLKKLSMLNQGFSRHIYEASDAALQLRNFYKEIASPLLSNIKFEYVPETTSLTKTNFPIHFAGSEIVISGRLSVDTFPYIPRVRCICETGPVVFQATISKPVSSIERLWAYLTVQQLLDEREIAADKSVNEKKALNLALQYSFVTPVSSLVVVKPNSDDFSIDPEAADKVSTFPDDYLTNMSNISTGFGSTLSKLFGSIHRKKHVKQKLQEATSILPYSLIPGLNTAFINKLWSKVNTMEDDEKHCVVCFDELRLRQSIESIAGSKEAQGQGEEKKEVDHALVFYIRGLLFEWGIPFCYFLSSGAMKANNLRDVILEVIQKLQLIGLNPRVLTCDHSVNNRTALSALGASLINTTITVNNTMVYTCYDVPHLLNNVRNYFMNLKLQILIDGNEISWTDIIQVYELNKENQITQEMQKVSYKHIKPTISQRKRVLFAAQVFSKAVSAAIKAAIQTDHLKSKTANYTAMFVDKMNDIFDVLNSNTLEDPHPQKCALSAKNLIALKTLQEAEDFFTSIQLYKNNEERKFIYNITGFIWTVKSVLQLWETLQKENKQYLLTSRLNLDPIKNLFLRVNYRNGTFSLPSFEVFRTVLEESMDENLSKPIGPSDYETVDDILPDLSDTDEDMEDISSGYSDYDE